MLIKQINPVIKLAGFILLTMILAYRHRPYTNLFVCFVCFIYIHLYLYSEKRDFRQFYYLLLPVLLMATVMFFTGYHFVNTKVVSTAVFNLAEQRFYNGCMFGSRVLVYAMVGLLFTFTTDQLQLTLSLQQQLHMKPLYAYGVFAVWGIFPQLMKEYRKTIHSFRARGIHVLPFSPRVLINLFVKTVKWSNDLSMAMESKGFDGYAIRQYYYKQQIKLIDYIFMVFIAVCCVLIIMI